MNSSRNDFFNDLMNKSPVNYKKTARREDIVNWKIPEEKAIFENNLPNSMETFKLHEKFLKNCHESF